MLKVQRSIKNKSVTLEKMWTVLVTICKQNFFFYCIVIFCLAFCLEFRDLSLSNNQPPQCNIYFANLMGEKNTWKSHMYIVSTPMTHWRAHYSTCSPLPIGVNSVSCKTMFGLTFDLRTKRLVDKRLCPRLVFLVIQKRNWHWEMQWLTIACISFMLMGVYGILTSTVSTALRVIWSIVSRGHLWKQRYLSCGPQPSRSFCPFLNPRRVTLSNPASRL